MKNIFFVIQFHLLFVVISFAQDHDNGLTLHSDKDNFFESYKKLEPDNTKWRSNLIYDKNTGMITLSVMYLANNFISIDLNYLLDTCDSDQGLDPGFTIKLHASKRKMPLDELMKYKDSIRPMEEKILDLNKRYTILYADSLSRRDISINRILHLNNNETLHKSWYIKNLYNWNALREFLKQFPSEQVDLTKGIYIPEGKIKEYIVTRCPLSYKKIEKINKENLHQNDDKQNVSLKYNKSREIISVTLSNPEHELICYNLDDSFDEKNNKDYFLNRFRFSTVQNFENDKTQNETSLFITENPFPEKISHRIVWLRKNENVTKTTKIVDLPIWTQLLSVIKKNKKEEYIIWFPIRYKKGNQIITDFASLKVNYESISDWRE